jgi:hypothetical protein
LAQNADVLVELVVRAVGNFLSLANPVGNVVSAVANGTRGGRIESLAV